jgi:hypothetical protein
VNSAWGFLPVGYALSVAVETPVLLMGLSRRHGWRRRIFAGLWLTACTYPIVVLALPVLIPARTAYVVVAETFAPVAECALFYALFRDGRPWSDRSLWRDLGAIVAANLASFGFGEWLYR